MILELDIGNSRIKWRQLQGKELLSQGVVPDIAGLQSEKQLQTTPVMVRMCSVRGEKVNHQLGEWVQEFYGLQLKRALVTQSCGGVSNNYADVSRLGIDRWLAMLAAYQLAQGACVIVDAGTALTIDVLNSNGRHSGGYIIPGLELMRSSLLVNTGVRLTDTDKAISKQLGHSSDEAVLNGTLAVVLALIEKVSSAEARLFLAGGDGEVLAKMLEQRNAELIPSLVLDGLSIACPFVSSENNSGLS